MKVKWMKYQRLVILITAYLLLGFNSKAATITAIGSTNLCQSRPFVTLVASPSNALNYTWYFYDVYGNLNQLPNPSSSTFDAFYSGNYFCIITDANGVTTSNTIMVSQAWNGQFVWQYQSSTTACGVNNLAVNTNGIYFSTFQWTLNGQIIPGANTPNYAATIGGHYNCWVGNSCGADTNTYGLYIPYVATAIPSVVSITSSVGNNACVSSPFTLSVPSYAGTTYKWYYLLPNGSSNLISSSNANVLSMPGYNNAATYRYYCNLSNACATRSSLVDTMTFVTSPAVAVSTASSNFCIGDSLKLEAITATGGLQYQWNNNGVLISNTNSPTYYAKASGNYSVYISNGGTCNINSTAIPITQRYNPSAVITPISPTTICSGDSVQLVANSGTGLTYQWLRNYNPISGASNLNYNCKLTGNYRVVVTNLYGCSKQSSAITVTVNPKPSAVISAAGATTFCSGGNVLLNANTGSGLTYDWRKNNVAIVGASSSQFSASLAGNYRCVVTNTFGCYKWSNTITVSVPCKMNEADVEEAKFEIYPNPASDFVIVKLAGVWSANLSVQLLDISGRNVSFQSVLMNDEIQIHGLNEGCYQIRVIDDNHSCSKWLLVQ